MSLPEWIKVVGLSDALDIVFMALLIYSLLVLVKRTKAAFVLTGLVMVAGTYLVVRQFNLFLTSAVFEAFLPLTLIVVVVIFQEEIRHFFEQVAVWSFYRRLGKRKAVRLSREEVEILVRTLADLARERIGALVVLQAKSLVLRHLEGGVTLNGKLSEPLLKSLFDPHSEGHDGAVVIDDDRITQFGCTLPLSKNLKALEHAGTRHAAALGISELSDALCLVVSEERGTMSAARNGRLQRIEDAEALNQLLEKFYDEVSPAHGAKPWQDFFKRNYREKVFALCLATALWFVLAHGSESTYRKYLVPVEYSPLPAHLTVVDIEPKAVLVTFSGTRRNFYFLSKKKIRLLIKIWQLKKGRQVIKLSGSNFAFPPPLHLESVEPPKVAVTLEQQS